MDSQGLYNRSCREYWFDKRRTADIIEHAKNYGLSWSRPKYFSQDNLEWLVGKNEVIKFNNNYTSPVGESYLGQTCTIEYEGSGLTIRVAHQLLQGLQTLQPLLQMERWLRVSLNVFTTNCLKRWGSS